MDIPGLFIMFLRFMNGLSAFIITLTLLFFIWGIFKLIFYGKDSKERAEAKGYIVWGLIALAVMVSIWGLVNLLLSTFNFGTPRTVIPEFPNRYSI